MTQDEAQRRADAAHLMELPQFQRFAYWLMFQLAPIDGPTFSGEQPLRAAYCEGRRSVSIDVGSLLRGRNFKAWQHMEQEAELRRQAPIVQDETDSSGHA